ncbi:MAG: glycoside hydrolase family 9 protein [Asticcacaulis sp.]
MVQAVRMLYYQRAGFAKDAQYAGEVYADKASHMGPHQDTEARLFSAKGDKSTERDLHGGWYDAGDFNRYTRWAGDDVVNLLHAYSDNPAAFTDDFNIPESGNGVPDLLDEVKWEIDWMVRMQNDDGSLLCVLGVGSGSPPRAAHDPSYYGPATTAASYGGAMAFAYAAAVYGKLPQFADYAAGLKARAVRAWLWAQANPRVIFHNNDANSPGLAAGDQEIDDHGRQVVALDAAVYLFNLTGDDAYRRFVDAHWRDSNAGKGFLLDFDYSGNAPLLDYAANEKATPSVVKDIRQAFGDELEGPDGWSGLAARTDPYGSYMGAYIWGSNDTKANHGSMFADEALYGVGAHSAADDMAAAENYVHYFHGVNPLGKVYLSNMKAYGAEDSVDHFYHTWYAPGSKWDSAAKSPYGPPPGYLVGGANPTYNWSKGCPGINPGCGSAPLSPPAGQPPQKSYTDFNNGWPIDSWEVTEPDIAYQAAYIRLLARFVR